MFRRNRWIIIVCFIAMTMASYRSIAMDTADANVFWNGYHPDSRSEAIVELDLTSGEVTYYRLDGYMIEKSDDEEGALVATIHENDKNGVSISRCTKGEIASIVDSIEIPNLVRVIGYKHGWIYYVYQDLQSSHMEYRYARMNKDMNFQDYPSLDYCIDYSWDVELIDMTCAISDDGLLAYSDYSYEVEASCDHDFLCDCTPYRSYDEQDYAAVTLRVVSIEGDVKEVGPGKYPTWISDHELIYLFNGKLQKYDIRDSSAKPFMDLSAKPIECDIYTGRLSVDPQDEYVLFTQYQPRFLEDVASSYQPLAVVSLRDGSNYLTQRVLMRDCRWGVWG